MKKDIIKHLAETINDKKAELKLSWKQIEKLCTKSKVKVSHKHNIISDRVKNALQEHLIEKMSDQVLDNRGVFFKSVIAAIKNFEQNKISLKEDIYSLFFNQKIQLLTYYHDSPNNIHRGLKTILLYFGEDNIVNIKISNKTRSARIIKKTDTVFCIELNWNEQFLELTGVKDLTSDLKIVSVFYSNGSRLSNSVGFIHNEFVNEMTQSRMGKSIMDSLFISELNSPHDISLYAKSNTSISTHFTRWKKMTYKGVLGNGIDKTYLNLREKYVANSNSEIDKVFNHKEVISLQDEFKSFLREMELKKRIGDGNESEPTNTIGKFIILFN